MNPKAMIFAGASPLVSNTAVRELGEVVPGSQRVSGDKTGECPTKDVLKLDDDNSLEARRF